MKELKQPNAGIIEELQSKIRALENENRLLKERLDEAGVSYADIAADSDTVLTEQYDPDQGARIRKFEVTDKNANAFFLMFCRGRKDVYDLRYTNPKLGKTGIIHSAIIGGIHLAISREETEYDVRTVRSRRTNL